jgi:outer membrane autotransporter protein
VTTDRYVTLAGTDHLVADFSANNVGGRIEGGYRFAIPGMLGLPGRSGITPYAAGQLQAFRTPSYSESAASGSSVFALAYEARTTMAARSELGAWLDWSVPTDYGTTLALRTRAAWAHDYWSATNITAMFEALPGSSFTVTGAAPARDLLLASAGAELGLSRGWSLAAWFDGEFAEHAQRYGGTGRLRYTW